jgi:hypothetical protein
MSLEALSARELTSRLVGRAPAQSGAREGAALAAHAASERTYRSLTRSLGSTGAQALLTRALAQAQAEHTILKELRVGRPPEVGLVGVTELIQAHGALAVAAGLEAVLETLLGLLGRLIGHDMVAQLVEQTAPVGTRDDEDVK